MIGFSNVFTDPDPRFTLPDRFAPIEETITRSPDGGAVLSRTGLVDGHAVQLHSDLDVEKRPELVPEQFTSGARVLTMPKPGDAVSTRAVSGKPRSGFFEVGLAVAFFLLLAWFLGHGGSGE